MRTQKNSDKRCVLNKKGLEKLNKALEKIFCCKSVNITDTAIQNKTRVEREMVGKIRRCNEALTRSSLEKLFDSIDKILSQDCGQNYPISLNIEKLLLNDEDYDRLPSKKSAYLDIDEANTKKTNSKNIDIDVFPKLKTALMALNYEDQHTLFSSWRKQRHKTGAFIIKGRPKRGQRWLVNRLLQQEFREIYEIDEPIPIMKPTSSEKLTEEYKEFGLKDIWQELGRYLGSGRTAEECVEAALDRWRNEHLIIAVYTDRIYQEIPKLLQEFWHSLTKKVSEEPINESYLLMFLIDSSDRASQWGLETISSTDLTNWHPQKPISLPPIEKLGHNSDRILYHWFEDNRNFLGCPRGTQDPESNLENVVTEIWEQSDSGIPEVVFDKICRRLHPDLSWSKFEQQLQYKL